MFGTLEDGFDFSITSLPALPSPFPSPSHDETSNRGTATRKPRHELPGKTRRHRKPYTVEEEDVLTQSQHLRSAAFLARGADWLNSKSFSNVKHRDLRPSTSPAGAERASCPLQEHSHPPPLLMGPVRNMQKTRETSLPQMRRRASQHEDMEILVLRHTLNLPKEAMTQACDLFSRYADPPPQGLGSLRDRRLTENGFTKVWLDMTHQEAGPEAEIPPAILMEAFKHAKKGQVQGLDFSEFATWFSSYYFSEHVSVDEDGRHIRRLARKHGMHHADVEKYRRIFNSFDSDGSGTIDGSEFEKLLCVCTKVPQNIGLPPARVKHLWQIADMDGDQEIDFEEFLTFYVKYLSINGTGFEDFYRFGGRPTQA